MNERRNVWEGFDPLTISHEEPIRVVYVGPQNQRAFVPQNAL